MLRILLAVCVAAVVMAGWPHRSAAQASGAHGPSASPARAAEPIPEPALSVPPRVRAILTRWWLEAREEGREWIACGFGEQAPDGTLELRSVERMPLAEAGRHSARLARPLQPSDSLIAHIHPHLGSEDGDLPYCEPSSGDWIEFQRVREEAGVRAMIVVCGSTKYSFAFHPFGDVRIRYGF